VRRDAIGQLQEAAQPIEAIAPEGDDLLPVLGPGDDRAQGDDDDVLELMQPPMRLPGALQPGKEPGDRQVRLPSLSGLGKRGHRSPP
jgi:hypothetical protein